MSFEKVKLPRWGPKALRELISQIEKELNRRAAIPGLGIYVNETEGGREISTHATTGSKSKGIASGESVNDPFTLIESTNTDTPPKPTVAFEVGKFGNAIPKLDGTPLSDAPSHVITSAGNYQAWLQVNISAANDNYHPQIDDAEILIEVSNLDPMRRDFKVEWVDESNRVDGAFFVLIADFTVALIPASDPPTLTISSIDQWLRQSYRAISMVGFVENDYIFPIG